MVPESENFPKIQLLDGNHPEKNKILPPFTSFNDNIHSDKFLSDSSIQQFKFRLSHESSRFFFGNCWIMLHGSVSYAMSMDSE